MVRWYGMVRQGVMCVARLAQRSTRHAARVHGAAGTLAGTAQRACTARQGAPTHGLSCVCRQEPCTSHRMHTARIWCSGVTQPRSPLNVGTRKVLITAASSFIS